MHAMSERFDHEGWMDAWTEFDASGFRYQIVSERGSDKVRNKVLRALLNRERELIASGDFALPPLPNLDVSRCTCDQFPYRTLPLVGYRSRTTPAIAGR
jgi:hypothetical protein